MAAPQDRRCKSVQVPGDGRLILAQRDRGEAPGGIRYSILGSESKFEVKVAGCHAHVIQDLCFCTLRAALPFRNSREGSWPESFAGLWCAVSRGSRLRSRDDMSFGLSCVRAAPDAPDAPDGPDGPDRWRWAFETRAVLGLTKRISAWEFGRASPRVGPSWHT